MNRMQRRNMAKQYRQMGLTKQQAKDAANQHIGETFKVGDKVRFNFQLIIRHPHWKLQKEEFREWVIAHKDDILTVCQTKENGRQVRFEEDENEEKFWHDTQTLFPLPTATIKLDDGTEKKIVIEDTKNIEGEINKAMEGEMEGEMKKEMKGENNVSSN